MVKFICVCIIIMNWVIIPMKVADQFRLPKETFFDITCMGIIVLSFLKGVRHFYTNKYFAWFVGWVFFTIFMNWYLPFTIVKNNQQLFNVLTISPSLHFILGAWASYIALSFLVKEDFYPIAKAICFSAVLTAVYALLQQFGLDPMADKIRYLDGQGLHATAFLGHYTNLGNYLALSIPFFFVMKEWKWRISGLLVVLCIFATTSAMSKLAFFIGVVMFLILCFRQNKRILWGIIGISALCVAVTALSLTPAKIASELNGRQEIWRITVNHLKDNPLFGQGLGVFWAFGDKIGKEILTNPHNDYLLIAVELGLLGLFLFALIVVNTYKRFNYSIDNKIGFAYLTSFTLFLFLMLGSFVVEFAPCALLGMISFWGSEKL